MRILVRLSGHSVQGTYQKNDTHATLISFTFLGSLLFPCFFFFFSFLSHSLFFIFSLPILFSNQSHTISNVISPLPVLLFHSSVLFSWSFFALSAPDRKSRKKEWNFFNGVKEGVTKYIILYRFLKIWGIICLNYSIGYYITHNLMTFFLYIYFYYIKCNVNCMFC